jgi:hypothetical chaperone protein
VSEYVAHGAEGRLFRSLKRFLPEPSFNGTQLHGRFVNLTELIGIYLKVLRERACAQQGADVRRAVFGRPAVFSTDPEKDALAEKRLEASARHAGFTDVSFCPEPVAAAHEFRHALASPRTVLIADFGGGTSDFTVARLGPTAFKTSDVLATYGVDVAGDRFDGALMRHEIAPHFGTDVVYKLPMGANDLRLPLHFVSRLCAPAEIALLGRGEVLQILREAQRYALTKDDVPRIDRLLTLIEDQQGYRLFRAIEEAKIALSGAARAAFAFDYPGIELAAEVRADAFAQHGEPLVEKIMGALDETLRRAQIRADGVDIVCMTGGTAKVPAIKRELTRRFGEVKMREHRNFHSVVFGLAERAKELAAQ